MAANPQNRSNYSVTKQVARILEEGRVSRRDYFQLVSFFLSDISVSEEERRQINSVFDALQMGRIRISD
ncbi:MAG: hypothetical protein SW833_06610 [Cyanobacteriota bacterium]|nr:hypothetical protein [Cyanobacteriota bacterium]